MIRMENIAILVGVIAVIISIIYGSITSQTFGYVAGISILIILISLYYMLGKAEIET